MSESVEQGWKTLPPHTYERYAAHVRQTTIVQPLDKKAWENLPIDNMSVRMIENQLQCRRHPVVEKTDYDESLIRALSERTPNPDGSHIIPYKDLGERATELTHKINQLGKLSGPAQRRADFLEVVKGYVTKDRSNTHGDAEDNFEDIAQMLTIVLRKQLKEPIRSYDVARIMMCVKLARTVSSPDNLDHWHDIAGYAACGGGILMAHNAQSDEPSKL